MLCEGAKTPHMQALVGCTSYNRYSRPSNGLQALWIQHPISSNVNYSVLSTLVETLTAVI
jgi:hypothetical protein